MAGMAATWIAALATIVVLGGLLGERRLFGWAQHLLAGLATGYLAVLVISEVVVPRLVTPLAADPGGRPELWIGLGMVGLTAASPWLPRRIAAVPISIILGSLAAFALGGAVIGTLLPQLTGAIVSPGSATGVAGGLLGLAITILVLVTFLHGAPRLRVLVPAVDAGRWLLLAGIGGWLGYLLLGRLALLIDRVGFLLFDWIGFGR